jgi:hypothetical protein
MKYTLFILEKNLFGEKYSDTVTVNEVNNNAILFAAYAKFKKNQFLNVEINSRGT